jgi:hypothetical protein
METEVTEVKHINKVSTSLGELSEKNSRVIFRNDLFNISIYKMKDGSTIIKLEYTVIRPCHDHNNHPSIEVRIPKDGVLACECGKHQERNAELTIETDAGHLMLKTFFKNYIWNKRARFGIPSCCWDGKDQK